MTRPAPAFRFLPHTADVRAEVRGHDPGELYGNAVALLRALLVGDAPVEPRERRRLVLAAGDPAERFFRFVRELLYLFDAEGFLAAEVVLEDGEAVVAGEPLSAERHPVLRQVKAVTRHGFRLERTGEGWRAELVFDL